MFSTSCEYCMPLLSIVLASRLGVVAGDCRATLRKGHDMQPL